MYNMVTVQIETVLLHTRLYQKFSNLVSIPYVDVTSSIYLSSSRSRVSLLLPQQVPFPLRSQTQTHCSVQRERTTEK